jgi:hypothetical protein
MYDWTPPIDFVCRRLGTVRMIDDHNPHRVEWRENVFVEDVTRNQVVAVAGNYRGICCANKVRKDKCGLWHLTPIATYTFSAERMMELLQTGKLHIKTIEGYPDRHWVLCDEYRALELFTDEAERLRQERELEEAEDALMALTPA